MDSYTEFILSQCAQRMYLLKLLRHQVLPAVQLSVVAYAVIISRLLYALPAWGGFLSAELVNSINVFPTSAAFWVYSVSFNCCRTYG